MPTPVRDYDFQPGTVVRSAQVDAEFDELYQLLSGILATGNVRLRQTTAFQTGTPDDEVLTVLGQVAFGMVGNGRVFSLWKVGETSPRLEFLNTGSIRIPASIGSINLATQLVTLSGALSVSTTEAPNTNAAETDLHTVQVGQYVTDVERGVIRLRAGGVTAANGNAKRFKLYVDAGTLPTVIPIIDSGSITPNNKNWSYDLLVFAQPGLASWRIVGTFKCDSTVIDINQSFSGINPAENNTIRFTGQGVATSDVVQNYHFAEKARA